MKLSHIILENMAYLPSKELGHLGIANLKQQLSISNRYNPEDVLLLFDDSRRDYFGVPLYFWKSLKTVTSNIIDNRVQGNPIKFSMRSTPLPDQDRVLTDFRSEIADGRTGFILNAPPGWGKTRTIIEMIQILGRNALVVVPTSNLVGQWVERILEHTSMTDSDIGVFNKGKAVYSPKKKITIGLVHTLALSRFHQYYKDFGVVAFDEVHASVPPKTFAPVAQLSSPLYRIGASATLKRDDGWDKAFEYNVEQVRFIGDASSNRMPAKVYFVNYPKSSGTIPSWVANDKIKTRAILISMFSQNRERINILACMAKQSEKSGRRTCIISDRTSILLDMYNILTQQMGYAKEDVGFYCSSISSSAGVKIRTVGKKEQEHTAKTAKIILSTYGLMFMGTDIPDLACIILATPRSKSEQTKGRVERVFSGKKQPIVMDVIDTFYSPAETWAEKRRKEYNGSKMVIENYHYTTFMK